MTPIARLRPSILLAAVAALILSLTGAPAAAQDGSVPARPTGLNTLEPEKRYVHRIKTVNPHAVSTWSWSAKAQEQEEPPGQTSARTAGGEDGAAAEIEEIVVFGRRRDAQLSIEAKRNADQIVDVLTSDQASRLPDNNIAEALGRIPGVSFRRSGETGNGNFISVRGLDSALNTISFDEVKSGLASSGRRVPLDGITTDDVAELRIIKSLLPRDAGEGIGGTVNVISRKPLDYDGDNASVTLEGRYGEFADEWGYRSRLSFNKFFSERFAIRFSASLRQRKLRNFELDATSSNLQYLPPLTDAEGNDVDNDFVLDNLDDPGSSFDNVSAGFFPVEAIVFEEHTYEVQDQKRDTLSLSGAIEWQATPSTSVLLSGRFNRQKASAVENSIAFDSDDDDFEAISGVLHTVFDDPEIDFESQIEDEEDINASLYLSGITELDRLTLSYRVSYSNARNEAPETDIDFDTGSLLDDDAVKFVPFSFRSKYFPVPNASVTDDPDFMEAITNIPGTQILDDFSMDVTNERTNDRFGLKLDADYQLGLDFLGGSLAEVRAGAEFERSEVTDNLLTLVSLRADALNLDGTFNPDFEGSGDGEYLERFDGLFGGFVSLDPLDGPLESIGLKGIPVLNKGAFRRLAATFSDSFLASGENPYEVFFFNAEEELLSGYFQAGFEAGGLSVVGGARVERYRGSFSTPLELDAYLVTVNLTDPADENSDQTEVIDFRSSATLDVIHSAAQNTELLPRMNFLYRFNDNFQLRGGGGYSIARPTFYQLGYATSISLVLEAEADRVGDTPVLPGVTTAAEVVAAGLSLDQLTDLDVDVRSGNPQLDNAKSLNLDVSLEYFPMRGTALSLGLFHKEIDNFIFVGSESLSGGLDLELVSGLLSPDAQTLFEQLGGLEAVFQSDVVDDLDIIQPRNGGTARVSGIEFAVSHQFSWAAGWFSRTGFSANAAYTRSEAEVAVLEAATPFNPNAGLEDDEALVVLGFAGEGDGLYRRTDFFNSPAWSGNATMFYEGDNLEIALSLQFQSSAFDSLDDFGFDQYSGRYSQWDFYMEYDLPDTRGLGSTSVYLEIPDVTDSGRNPTDLQTLGRTRRVVDEASFNGREFRIGVRGRF